MVGVTGLLAYLAVHPQAVFWGPVLVAALSEGAGMAILSKDQIFSTEDIPSQVVPVPEWGGEVIVRGLTGHDRDQWEQSMMVRRGRKYEQNMTDFRARLVALCIIDEKGQPLFHAGDVQQLSSKSAAALDRVYSVAAELSGISEKDVEDLTKDFGPEDGGGSPTT
jgi:hypothetical protein